MNSISFSVTKLFSISLSTVFRLNICSLVLLGSIACSQKEEKQLDQVYFLDHKIKTMVRTYCVDCHNPEKDEGELDLESILEDSLNEHVTVWEDVAWMLEEREMPPEDEEDVKIPTEEEFELSITWLNDRLNAAETAEKILLAQSPHTELVEQYCLSCHNAEDKKAGLVLETIYQDEISSHTETWEKVLRKLSARQMPPKNRRRPPEIVYAGFTEYLAETLDQVAAQNPNVGRLATFRRLNRTEYQNAIRDLLGLQIDASELLPADEASHGFDNITVSNLSPTLLNRYLEAAQKISRLAIGSPSNFPDGKTIRIRPDVTQEKHVPGLPLGSRGGVNIAYNFPESGEYDIQINLARDRNEKVEGLADTHMMEVLLDRKPVQTFAISPPQDKKNYYFDDSKLVARVDVEAGPRDIGVTFQRLNDSLVELRRQPYNARFNFHRHPRLSPAVYQVSINGPYNSKPIAGSSTPSRNIIFSCYPTSQDDQESCAQEIITQLTRKAFRREVSDTDLEKPLQFYREAITEGNFDHAIEMALNSILVSPNFIFKVEYDPENYTSKKPFQISDIELASRLSFFLWNSLPDEELLTLAIENKLSKPKILAEQVQRLLDDKRSEGMIKNFASQWLYLRNLDSHAPDFRLFTDFDDNLRQAFRSETELFVASVFSDDRSVTDLLKANYTFLNERLAKHYGIPHIYGSRFRRVDLPHDSYRGGLLRQGSILTITSYATRTSPVVRGHWILENLIGTPPPPAPPDVPSLEDEEVSESLPVRERLAKHREDPSCASCHDMMDPVGFALENYDAVGRWRTLEHGKPVDASAGMPDGAEFVGVAGLENAMLAQPDAFVRTLTEKLMTFALGRGVEHYDAPTVRTILRNAKEENYSFSALVRGIVTSPAFTSRMPASKNHNTELAQTN